MSDLKNNSDEPNTDLELKGNKHPDQKRRALTKAALTAPVLGALASKPALGAARTCSVSVLMSGNTSIDTDWDSCGGCSPGFWFNKKTVKACYFPDAVTQATTFGSVFNKAANSSASTLYEHILNVLSGWVLGEFNTNYRNDFLDDVAKAYGLSGSNKLLPNE